jgi:VanZ family protein
MMPRPIIRLLIAVIYTALIAVLLLQPSRQPVIGPAAPPGPPTLGRELLLIAAHLIAFAGLTGVWWWAGIAYLRAQQALGLAVAGALSFSLLTEILQAAVPDRSTSWLDLATNTLAVLLVAWWITRR